MELSRLKVAYIMYFYKLKSIVSFHTLTPRTRFSLSLQRFYLKKQRVITISAANFTQIGFQGSGKNYPRGTLAPRFTHLPS